MLRRPARVNLTAKYATVLAATFFPAASALCNKAAAWAMVSWINSDASSAPMGLAADGTAERIRGTTSVHNTSPAWGLISLSFLVGKAKTPPPVRSRRFSLSVGIEVRSRGSEEAEPTAALGLCQVFIAQEEGLLRGAKSKGEARLHWSRMRITPPRLSAVEPVAAPARADVAETRRSAGKRAVKRRAQPERKPPISGRGQSSFER